MYVSLEPCNHFGKTPPCSQAVIAAKIARVVIGALDPNPKTARGGIEALKAAGIAVEVADFAPARALIEPFAVAIRSAARPFVALKMAASIDGFVASCPGVQEWLTGEPAREAVRDLRIQYDAVMVGAGTVRVDDPQLTVRPAHARLRPYTRVVACETDSVAADCRIFAPEEGYAQTVVLAPGAKSAAFAALHDVARVVPVGDGAELDVPAALRALRELGVQSVLCEGGPTFAGRLLALGLVDRLYWLIAPRVIGGTQAVPALNPPQNATLPSIAFDRVERLGDDLMLSGMVQRV
jgi:diaminohydroxyphosphoribosylaminopyrimidine deaminase/5-amino-6-(5-phosphoribosylamino)uracil reductase